MKFYGCRLWKINPQLKIKKLIKKVDKKMKKKHKGKKLMTIDAVLLNDKKVLEDAELGDTDTVVVEFRINNDFLITTDKLQYENVKNSCA